MIADDDVITLVAVDDVTLVTADHDVVIGVTVEGIDRAEAFPRGFDALDQRGGPDTVGRFSLGNHTVVAEHNVISGVAVQGVSARCRRGQHAEHRGDIGRIDQCSDLVLREQQQVDIEGSVAVDMIVAGFAVDGIATAAAGQVIVVLTAVDNVVAKSAEDHNADIVVILSEHLRSIDRVDTGIIETGAVDRGCRLVVAITHAVF